MRRLSPALRWGWSLLTGLLLLAQTAAAAGYCIGMADGTYGMHPTAAAEPDRHHDGGGGACASDFVPDSQIPALDPSLPVLAPAPGFVAAPATPMASHIGVASRSYEPPPAGVARFLEFGRLRR